MSYSAVNDLAKAMKALDWKKKSVAEVSEFWTISDNKVWLV